MSERIRAGAAVVVCVDSCDTGWAALVRDAIDSTAALRGRVPLTVTVPALTYRRSSIAAVFVIDAERGCSRLLVDPAVSGSVDLVLAWLCHASSGLLG